jgi:DNA anti-recombination protein RmuC|tara:strand:+ start:946 stop:1185 length:240 start_codon:yes stop_codon:yes gene_type:complete
MSIDTNTLVTEGETLKKDFDSLSQKIAKVEKDLGTMKSNLNAVFGAIQLTDKLIADSTKSDPVPDEVTATEVEDVQNPS